MPVLGSPYYEDEVFTKLKSDLRARIADFACFESEKSKFGQSKNRRDAQWWMVFSFFLILLGFKKAYDVESRRNAQKAKIRAILYRQILFFLTIFDIFSSDLITTAREIWNMLCSIYFNKIKKITGRSLPMTEAAGVRKSRSGLWIASASKSDSAYLYHSSAQRLCFFFNSRGYIKENFL